MNNRKWLRGVIPLVLLLLCLAAVCLFLTAQKPYEPAGDTKTAVERSQVLLSGAGYHIDDGQAKERERIEKQREKKQAREENQVSQNSNKGGVDIPSQKDGPEGETNPDGKTPNAAEDSPSSERNDNDGKQVDNDWSQADDEEEDGGNGGTSVNDDAGEEEDSTKPLITTDLRQVLNVSGTFKTFYIHAEDYQGTYISAYNLVVTCNGTKLSSTSDTGRRANYRAELNNGSNVIVVTATDKKGRQTTTKYELICDIQGQQTVAGHITITVKADTVSLGTVAGPTTMEYYQGEQLSYVFKRFMESKGLTFNYAGTLSNGFYLSRINKVGMTASAVIPHNLQDYLDDAGATTMPHQANSLGQKDYTNQSGWELIVNGEFPSTGMSGISPHDGDEIAIVFTLWNGKDVDGTWQW